MSQQLPCIDFEKLFQTMPVPRFIVRVEQEVGHFTLSHANALALEYFDKSLEQIEGRSVEAFMSHDSAVHFQQSFEVCTLRRQSVTIQTVPSVPHKIRVSGFHVSPILDDQDEAVAFLDVVGQVDVADQSVLQRERDDALSLLTSIFEVSEVGIIVSNDSGQIVRVNDSFVRTFGWDREELIDSDIISFITPDERDRARQTYEEFVKSGLRSSGELKFIHKNGSIANVLFTTATMELSQRRRFQVTTVMDITLRKQMEESLRQAKEQADSASRAKSNFLANMSHELRTPMNAILGFSEMMIKETFGPLGHAKYKEYLEDVHSSAEHLLQIINEVLDMSKIEAERIELDEHEISIEELMQSVIRMMASKTFDNDIDITLEMQDNLPLLHADERLVRQIFINLVTNAVKFSPRGEGIAITIRQAEGEGLEIVIQDNGPGIPADKIQHVLEPFGQIADSADNQSNQGTGLGLPLAKAMIDLHDGRLTLESQDRKGTRVSVIFPQNRLVPQG
jgi:PAS domain S-box-containing protein